MGQISQKDAHNAALKITESIKSKITLLETEQKTLLGEIYFKKLPQHVKDCFEKEPKYFHVDSCLYIVGQGISSSYLYMDKGYPQMRSNDRTFNLSKTDAEKVSNLLHEIKTSKENLRDTISEIETTILSLGTHKRVETEFPEAFPYLPTINTNRGLVIQIKPVRNKVKKLTAAQ